MFKNGYELDCDARLLRWAGNVIELPFTTVTCAACRAVACGNPPAGIHTCRPGQELGVYVRKITLTPPQFTPQTRSALTKAWHEIVGGTTGPTGPTGPAATLSVISLERARDMIRGSLRDLHAAVWSATENRSDLVLRDQDWDRLVESPKWQAQVVDALLIGAVFDAAGRWHVIDPVELARFKVDSAPGKEPAFPVTYLTHRAPIGPHCTAQITVRAQLPGLRPRALRVDPISADAFSISDIRVGINSQFVQAQTVPASRFARKGEEDGVAFHCDKLEVAMDFVMIVNNTSDKNVEFVATWTCDIVPPGFHPRLRGFSMEPGELAKHQAEEARAAEAQRAARQQAIGAVKSTNKDGTVDVALGKEDDPAIRRLRAECGPSATSFAPEADARNRDSSARNPPSWGWDPYGDE